jgi:hypothetical protein
MHTVNVTDHGFNGGTVTGFSAEQSQPHPYFALMRNQGEHPEMENIVHALDAIATILSRIDLRLSQLVSERSSGMNAT